MTVPPFSVPGGPSHNKPFTSSHDSFSSSVKRRKQCKSRLSRTYAAIAYPETYQRQASLDTQRGGKKSADSSISLISAIPQHLKFGLSFWISNGSQNSARDSQLLETTTERVDEAGQEQTKEQKSKRKDVKSPPLDIHHFLHTIGIMEIRYMRMLASMCNLTYYMKSAVSERSLFWRHGLRLVTTSLVFEKMVRESPRTPFSAAEEGDGMTADLKTVASYYESMQKPQKPPEEMKAIEMLKEKDRLRKMPTPAEIVGARLLSAYSAVFAAAAPLASNIGNNISHATSAAVGLTMGPIQALAGQLQSAASIGQSTALAIRTTITAALDTTSRPQHVTRKQAISSSYWFVADDEKANTRFFVIQGSNNIDHWKINLQFDPVVFEDPSLGLKVHRGFYEAAQILYDSFLPLVEEHLASDPFAKIVFTGHSLGGSCSTVLALLFLHRKIIPAHSLGPVYTFGAPAIFCETEPPSDEPAKNNKAASKKFGLSPSSEFNRVLERMGLNSGAIRNVMMHRDIVPRAFACDYALVADLLPLVSESFRNLECLRNPERQVMYHPLGRVLLLQPDEQQNFVFGGADHPMFPPGPNIYTLREERKLDQGLSTAKKLNPSKSNLRELSKSQNSATETATDEILNIRDEAEDLSEARRTGDANLGDDGQNIDDSGPDRSGGTVLGPKAKSVNEALSAIMDTPHPLDILQEPGSYGFNGAISRYHDPDHYCKALGGVLRARTKPYKNQLPGNSIATVDQIPKFSNISAGPNSKQRKKFKEQLKPMLKLLDTPEYDF